MEQGFLDQCLEHRLEAVSPSEWNLNVRMWACVTWRMANEASGAKKRLRAAIAGRLLGLWIAYQREKHPSHYKALSLASIDGLDPVDLYAVLEAGRHYLDIQGIVLGANEHFPPKFPQMMTDTEAAKNDALVDGIVNVPAEKVAEQTSRRERGRSGLVDLSATPFISEVGILELIQIIGSVERFVAHNCPHLSGDTLVDLSERCANSLKFFELSATPLVTPAAMEEVARSCTSLIDFSVQWMHVLMTTSFVKRIAAHWGFVTALDISRNHDVEDEAIRAIAKHCRSLKSLNLAGLPRITDGSLCLIARNCHRISRLNLSGCTKISSESVSEFALRTHAFWNEKLHAWVTADSKPVRSRSERKSHRGHLFRQKQNFNVKKETEKNELDTRNSDGR